MNISSFIADYQGAIVRPSPNQGERRGDGGVDMLIMHYTGMENAEAAERHLEMPESMVSAHYVVREDGAIVQMVSEKKRAWHAGESLWQGKTDINSRSIGIEVVNSGPLGNFPDFPAAQISALIALARDIIVRHDIKPRHVLAHSDIAPERKIDPGEKFPWGKLAAAGIGHYVEPAVIEGGHLMSPGVNGKLVETYQAMLALYGYGIPVTGAFDETTENITRVFQQHFRTEKIDGIADLSTVKTLHKLLENLDAVS